MKVQILGDNLEAWGLAGALAWTGCDVSMAQPALMASDSDMAEPDLMQLLEKQLAAGRLRLGVGDVPAELLLVTRRLPSLEDLKAAVERFLLQVAHDTAALRLIALTQSVALGTTDALQAWLEEQGAGHVRVLYWPAFVQAGRALESITRPERILIGTRDARVIRLMKRVLTPFNRSRDTLLVMPPKEAELSKLAINGMLATRVSYMNELARLASEQGIDIEQVRQGMGTDSRIGFQYLYPGCGFGGEAFLETLAQLGVELGPQHRNGLLGSVFEINEQQKDLLFQKFWRHFRAQVSGRCVALWGCAFKPNTSVIEGSPALTLIESLLAHDVRVHVYDPQALPTLKRRLGNPPGLVYADSAEAAAVGADALMLVTEWKEFWNLDMASVLSGMKAPLLLDGRNVFDPQQMAEQGWIYSGIGRGLSV